MLKLSYFVEMITFLRMDHARLYSSGREADYTAIRCKLLHVVNAVKDFVTAPNM
jgi:hypothetical protein